MFIESRERERERERKKEREIPTTQKRKGTDG
jgi:hypothetical protein